MLPARHDDDDDDDDDDIYIYNLEAIKILSEQVIFPSFWWHRTSYFEPL